MRRETEAFLDPRVLLEEREMVVLLDLAVPSVPPVLLESLDLKDPRDPRDQLVRQVRREILV